MVVRYVCWRVDIDPPLLAWGLQDAKRGPSGTNPILKVARPVIGKSHRPLPSHVSKLSTVFMDLGTSRQTSQRTSNGPRKATGQQLCFVRSIDQR